MELGVLLVPRNCKAPELGMSCSHVKAATERTSKGPSLFSKDFVERVSCSGQSPVVWEEEEWCEAG